MIRTLLVLIAFAITLSTTAQTPEKMVLFEKVTSAGCGGCAYGDTILDTMAIAGSQFIPVHIHWHNSTHIDSLTSVDGDSLLVDYLLLSPAGMIDRRKFSDLNMVPVSFLDDWKARIDGQYQEVVYCNVSGVARYDSLTRAMEVDISGEFLQPTSGEIHVNAYLMENGVVGSGPGFDQDNSFHTWPGHFMEGVGNPLTNYTHDHVLRNILGTPWGTPGIVPDPVSAGFTFTHTFQHTVSADLDETQLEVVVLVQRWNTDPNQRDILNANYAAINATVIDTTGNNVGLAESAIAPGFRLYPNPAQSRVDVRFSEAVTGTLGLTDLVGRTQWQQRVNGVASQRVDLQGLPAGVYFVWLEQEDGRRHTQRLVVR